MTSTAAEEQLQAKLQKAQQMSEEDKVYRYEEHGILYPVIMAPQENLRALKELKAREDDILLVAYPKCGFNWMVGVMRKIIAQADERKGQKSESKMPPLIEFLGPEGVKKMDDCPSPRLLGAHLHPDNIPKSFYEKKTKMLVIFRNPKDTLVSYYHFCKNNPVLPSQPWDAFFSQFMSGDVMWGSYFDHAVAWEKRMDEPNVMVVTYEDLKQDLSGSIQKISEFFGFELSDDGVQQITEQSSFRAMKESSAQSHGVIGDVIFRKGEVGDWKNYLTVAQSQQIDQVFDKRLSGTKMGQKLNYDRYC
ncbi:sulfotransferase 6B1 [Pholidichthys leucotaenia]